MIKTISLNLILEYIRTVFKYIRKYFVIEPLLILWILPACFNYVAIQNLGLEKVIEKLKKGFTKLITY